MGTKIPYSLTSTGQRSTAYTPNMLSGFTNRKDSIGDFGGLMAAKDEDEFRMKGVTDGPTLEQRQIEAAQKYANLVTSFPTTAQEIADVQAAKAKLVELNVSREQIEAQGIDASQGISGVMGPSVSGVLDAVGQGAIDLIGAGGQAFSDIITLGQGPDVAQTLLDPISILTGGFGGTVYYSQSGNTTPLILGNTTTTGMPVGINIPDPRTIWQDMSNAGIIPWLIDNGAGLGGLATTAAVAGGNALDTTNETGNGVGLSGASLIAAAEALDKNNGAVKTITGAEDIVAGGVGSDIPAIKTGVRDIVAGGVGSDIPAIKTSAEDIIGGTVDSASPVIKTGESTPTIKTGEPAGERFQCHFFTPPFTIVANAGRAPLSQGTGERPRLQLPGMRQRQRRERCRVALDPVVLGRDRPGDGCAR